MTYIYIFVGIHNGLYAGFPKIVFRKFFYPVRCIRCPSELQISGQIFPILPCCPKISYGFPIENILIARQKEVLVYSTDLIFFQKSDLSEKLVFQINGELVSGIIPCLPAADRKMCDLCSHFGSGFLTPR